MKLDCFVFNDMKIHIQPASSRREWMDDTHERFAYRCLPLSIANAHGWVILCEGGFEAEWNGGDGSADVQVQPLGDGPVDVAAHFGYGIITISPLAMFRTEPGYNLWVTGPPNSFKDGIQALSAVVETDWMPYSFAMNWKFTRPHQRIRFEKGEPYCFLFPVKRDLPESVVPALKSIREDPESERQVRYARNKRSFLRDVLAMKDEAAKNMTIKDARELNFQRWYMKGETPDGSAVFDDHQKALNLRPFEDLRSEEP